MGDGAGVVKYDSAHDGGVPGVGGTSTLCVNDQQVGQSRIENTVSCQFSLDEALDVCVDLATNVTDVYSEGLLVRCLSRSKKTDNAFTGTIH